MDKLDKRILITGGGSGGHVSVATAFLDGINERYQVDSDNVLYVGSDIGMEGEKSSQTVEERVMQKRNINFTTIRAGKLQRRFSITTVKLLLRTILGLIDSFKIVRDFRPQIIFCTGGYLSVPIALAGWLFKVPVYLHEQTAAVGLANRVVGRFAKKIYVSFESSIQYFPRDKTLLTGNVVRKSIFKTDGSTELCKAIDKMKTNKLPILYISGGGQGSHLLNLIVLDMLKYALLEYQIILQTGSNQIFRDYDMLFKEWKKLPTKLQERLFIIQFVNEDEIGKVFNSVDIYVGRSGANIVYEVGVLKIPSIFIPIPWVTHNEQTKNAQILVKANLGKILPEGEATSAKLHSMIINLITQTPNLKVDEVALEKQFKLDAPDTIINDILGYQK